MCKSICIISNVIIYIYIFLLISPNANRPLMPTNPSAFSSFHSSVHFYSASFVHLLLALFFFLSRNSVVRFPSVRQCGGIFHVAYLICQLSQACHFHPNLRDVNIIDFFSFFSPTLLVIAPVYFFLFRENWFLVYSQYTLVYKSILTVP